MENTLHFETADSLHPHCKYFECKPNANFAPLVYSTLPLYLLQLFKPPQERNTFVVRFTARRNGVCIQPGMGWAKGPIDNRTLNYLN